MSSPSAPARSVTLAALGDLVEDIVVRLDGPVRLASDTTATIDRRPGGSAANVTTVTAWLGARARFLGQVGDDAAGRGLVADLAAAGVDVDHVRHGGRTGTIVVLVDRSGERTMLTDRRACVELSDPATGWLDGVDVVHVPLYSLVVPPLSTTAETVVAWAHERHISVSIDVSSVTLLDDLGLRGASDLLERLAPDVVFANREEAAALEIDAAIAGAITVVKRGADPATVLVPDGDSFDVPALEVRPGADSTGAGDAFAAGFLTFGDRGARWVDDPAAACRAGHRAAAQLLSGRGPRPGEVITHDDGKS